MKRPYFIFCLFFLLFFFAYYPVIYDLRDSVMGNELAHHTPLVFALSGFLVYLKRQVLLEAFMTSGAEGTPVFFLTGLLLNILGQAAGVYYLSQLSIPLTVYGMAYYLKGNFFARTLCFPLVLLLLAFPIPGKLYMEAVFPLKLLVTKASGTLLVMMGHTITLYGNIIEISTIRVGVVDACSGLNSLMAIVTLSIFYSYLVIRRWPFRMVIILSMLPLIMTVNIIRVTTTALVAVKWGPALTEGWLHSAWGIAVFIMAVFGLMAITKIFAFVEDRMPHD